MARELLQGLLQEPRREDLVLLRFRGQPLEAPVEQVALGRAPRGFKDGAWLLDKVRVPLAAWRKRLDLLHIVAPMEMWYGYHVWRGMPPVVITAYDVIPALYPERSFPVHAWFTKPLYYHYLHLMKRAARILAISRTTADDLVGRFGFPASRIEVVPLGIQGHFRPAGPSDPLEEDLARLGVRRPYVLHVGGDSPHKNIQAVVAAVDRLLEEGHRVQLVLAGRYDTPDLGPVLEDLRRRRGEDAVRVLGFVSVPDLVRIYQGAQVFVFPSFYEGFGLPPLEAMACGTPAVVSDAPALVEFAGPGARVASPADGPTLARCLAEVLRDEPLRAELSAACRAWAARFTWERTLALTREGYRAALGG